MSSSIDLYQMHAWDALTPLEETLRFLDDAVRAGKIALLRLLQLLGWHVGKARRDRQGPGYSAPVTLQPQYNLLVRDIEFEIVPACRDAGMGLLPWSPLGGGWLTGKYKRDAQPTGATRLGENPNRGDGVLRPAQRVGAHLGDHRRGRGDRQDARCQRWPKSRSPGWPNGPPVTSVILGARTGEQLADNLGAGDVKLSDDEMAKLNEISAPEPSDYPYGRGGTTSGTARSKADGSGR